MISRMESAFAAHKTAIIPYLTVGDPDIEVTRKAIHTLVRAGADMIELGVPFTDPIADGPTIQHSAERALKNPFALADIFALVKRVRDEGVQIPLILMSYANPVYAYGFDAFCRDSVTAGVDGALITDLPPEESAEYKTAADAAGLKTVFLCSPTTSPERLRMIDDASTGFVYHVARAGVTGARRDLPADIADRLQKLRGGLRNKLCVGFGISTPAHAAALAPYADGLIIGSALMQLFERHTGDALQAEIHDFITNIVQAARHV